jgi:YHS domain-containing protein
MNMYDDVCETTIEGERAAETVALRGGTYCSSCTERCGAMFEAQPERCGPVPADPDDEGPRDAIVGSGGQRG